MCRRLVLILLLVLSGSGCNPDDEGICFDDRQCDVGMRCFIPALGSGGTCAPCEAVEKPYDGFDNDCDPATRDRDLDGDGDNALEGGGADCDDNDPAVSSKKAEICGDGRDNDCDADVDEIDCGDREGPTITFASPAENELVWGTFDVVAMVFDDVGIVRAQLFVNNVPVAAVQDFTSPVMTRTVTFTVDTVAEALPDGLSTLRIELEDVAGKAGQGSRMVILDNTTPPAITVTSPRAANSYGGFMTIEAAVTDGTGVANVEFSLGGQVVDTFTAPPYLSVVDTRQVIDGPTTVTIETTDGLGNTGMQEVPIRIDNTPPQIAFVEPMDGATVSQIVDVEVRASDASGIGTIWSLSETTNTSTLTYSFDSELLPNLPIVLTASTVDLAIVDDGASANSATASITVTIDNSGRAPQVTLVPGNGDAVFGSTTIQATATSPIGRSIVAVEIRVDGQPLTVSGRGPYTAAYDFLLHAPGSAVIEAVAYDQDGRPGIATATVLISTPPSFRITPRIAIGNGFNGDGYDVGDVTGDGIPDVVAGGSAVQLFQGTIDAGGDWSPMAARVIDSVNAADRLRLIDTDGDGDRDLITLASNRIRLYLNDGGLPATANVSSVLSQFTTYALMETADLDADGDADVVLAGPTGVDIVVARNDANAAFNFDARYGLVASITDLRLADADADGDLDAVVGRSGTSNVITTYRNDGAGVFGAGQDSFTTGAAQYVAIGDVTGDDYPDAVAVIPSGIVALLRGSSATPGTFVQTGTLQVPTGSRDVLVTDYDGDGALDLLINAYQANGLYQVRNLGGGTFPSPLSRTQFVVARRPVLPRLWDLDGDGDLDYLAISSSDQALAFAENLGNGDMFAAPVVVPRAAPRSIAAGDVYGASGRDDFAVGFAETGTTPARVSIWEIANGRAYGRGTIGLGTGITTPTSLSIGDLDGAGLLDIAVGSNETMVDMTTGDTPAVALLNDGNASFRRLNLNVQKPADTAIADVDNDGIGEAVFTFDLSTMMNFEGSEVWDVSSGAPVRLRQWAEGLGARAVAAGDLVADPTAFVDYVVANGTSNDITVSLWNGQGGWNTTTYTALPGIADVAVGFVGNDQYGDIIAVGMPGLVVLAGIAGGGFAQPQTWPAGASASKLITGDFNADGLTDVLVLNNNSLASILIGRPQGGFFPPLSIAVGDGANNFTSGDFDGDGRGDLAIACSGVPAIMLVYSNGDSL